MSHQPVGRDQSSGPLIRRRTLLGVALAAGVLGPLIGTGAARADSATDSEPGSEEYEIPDEIGSEPWW